MEKENENIIDETVWLEGKIVQNRESAIASFERPVYYFTYLEKLQENV